jgi:hypothetical protein
MILIKMDPIVYISGWYFVQNKHVIRLAMELKINTPSPWLCKYDYISALRYGHQNS